MQQRALAKLYFFRSVVPLTGFISLAMWGVARTPLHENFWRFLPLYLLLKLFTNTLVWYYLRKQNPCRSFFYSNLGISETGLYATAFTLDAGLFFLFILFVKFCSFFLD